MEKNASLVIQAGKHFWSSLWQTSLASCLVVNARGAIIPRRANAASQVPQKPGAWTRVAPLMRSWVCRPNRFLGAGCDESLAALWGHDLVGEECSANAPGVLSYWKCAASVSFQTWSACGHRSARPSLSDSFCSACRTRRTRAMQHAATTPTFLLDTKCMSCVAILRSVQ